MLFVKILNNTNKSIYALFIQLTFVSLSLTKTQSLCTSINLSLLQFGSLFHSLSEFTRLEATTTETLTVTRLFYMALYFGHTVLISLLNYLNVLT